MNRHERRAAEKASRAAASPSALLQNAIDKAPNGTLPAMNADRKAIGLCMIVKNESHVILRCLESVRPLVDYVLVEDTGSTDDTRRIVREWLDRQGLPGEVFDEPWRDFAYNRSVVLARLREKKDVDYALMIDADDHLVVETGFDVAAFKKNLSADEYRVEMRNGPLRYQRSQICSNRREYRYRGVLHEFLEGPPGGISTDTAAGFHIISSREGARNRDSNKYAKDAQVLEQTLRKETDPFLRSRYTYYLARSYRFAGEKEKALDNYLKRASLGHWAEEVFDSLFSAGQLMQEMGRPFDEVIAMYLRASDAAPGRAEALHAASRLCREKEQHSDGFSYALRGLEITAPADGLFVQPWVYDYGLLDELAVNAYWIGRFKECLEACDRLLLEGKIPASRRERVEQNRHFACAKLSVQNVDTKSEDLSPSILSGSKEPALEPVDVKDEPNSSPPRVLLAILAKQAESVLPFYLFCIDALDYPKNSIVLYVRTNNNTDRTVAILREWIGRVREQYACVEFDASDVPEAVQEFAIHEWNSKRFKVLGEIRQESMNRALQHNCDYYFVADTDNFVKPDTLKKLIATGLPIVAPLLRCSDAQHPNYSNFHDNVDARGYSIRLDRYWALLNQSIKDVVEVPVVHCTYLVRADVIPRLYYRDASDRHEYVIFSESARKGGTAQYLDTREVYGCLTLENDARDAIRLIGPQVGGEVLTRRKQDKARIFTCAGLHSSGSTWMFNLVREICRTQGIEFVSLHRDSEVNLPWEVLGSQLIVVKTHNPLAGFQSIIAGCSEPAVITVRDPRDAVVSLMQRFPNSQAASFNEAVKTIAFSAQNLLSLLRLREVPVFRYEDGFVGSVETFNRIAAYLGTSPSDEGRKAILAGLAPEAVKKKISDLEQTGTIRGEVIWDKDTHWHANHVGDGKVGKFKSILSPAEQHEIIEQTREFCVRFGYLNDRILPREMRDQVLKNKGLAVDKLLEATFPEAPESDAYIKLLHAAREKERLAGQENEIISAYSEASAACPTRAEALHGAARFCRHKRMHEQGYQYAAQGLAIAHPKNGLAVEDWIYQYGLLDELSVHAYWTGRYKECVDACDRLLTENKLPAEMRDRVLKNKKFAVDKLEEAAARPLSAVQPASAQIPQRQETSNISNRLHILGVAHTIPHEDYLVCAFTAKVLLFPEVIQPFGWNVIEYSNEGSVSSARQHVPILTKDRLQALSRRKSREEPLDADVDNTDIKKEFQQVLLEKIRSHASPGDIVCHVWGPNMDVYNLLRDCHHVELSVGYTASPGLPFRVYESSAWMHWHYGKAGQEDGNHYKWVIPSAFDADRWSFHEKPDEYAIFLGRVTQRKGMNTIVDIARRMPDLPIHVHGPGDPSRWAKDAPPNLVFKGPIFGDERVDVVQRARCMLMPTDFIEPFGFSGIEAQLCGVPLIGPSYGAFQETIVEGVTGYRCHTLADWVEAIKLSRSLDRRQIATLARSKYSKEVVGKQYDWVLKQVADLSGRGWYADKSRKFASAAVLPKANPSRKPRIWLYMPYFGAFPNYFQLYLDSLANNADCLSVFLMTDNDLSGYRVPENVIVVRLTLSDLRERVARFINDEFGMHVQPDALLKRPYKISDFRIMYLELFHDISEQHGVTDEDFVGWGDCDLIYGRFSDFLDMKEDYHVIGGFHGHLTAVRNIDSFRKLFRAVEGLPGLLLDENSLAVDEIAFRKPLLDFLERNGYKMFYANRYFCDIVPECFFGRFREDHAQRNKNFFDAYHPNKEINYVHYDRDGRLTVVYDDGESRQSLYCHLQKRAMSMDFERHENGYYIREDAFRLAS
jgi:tetratricopeptide (TPR) repeat protein